MKGQDILGYALVPTACDGAAAAEAALDSALQAARVKREDVGGIVSTGIFRDVIKGTSLNVTTTIPDYKAAAKGAIFLNKKSRTVIDIGGNVHKAVSYDEKGNLIDVIQNDKCADGLGLFYTTMAKAFGVTEEGLSDLALKSAKQVSVAIHCPISAESEAIDLLCQGEEAADVADAAVRFMVDRIAAMATTMPLTKEIVVAGGLAKSKALMKHLPAFLQQDVSVLDLPDYVGAIGAAMSVGGEK